MKKFIFSLLLVFCSLAAFAKEYRGMFVNSKEGLNIREEPNLKSAKLGALKYGEFVKVAGEGELVRIDGISTRWTKIILDHDGNDAADDYNNYGWVFGGYLQDECPMGEDEILDYLRLLHKTEEDWLGTDYFPENRYREYMRGKVWECPVFRKALPNYDCDYFGHETNKEVVAIRDCLVYWEPRAAAAYGALRFAKAGTKFKLWRVDDWGIDTQTKTLFPIYETDEHLLVRGIDVTGSDCVSRASDGKGGFHSLVYQPILEGISIDDVHNNVESADCSTTHEELEQYFSSNSVYERRWRSGGFNVNFAEHINPKGKKYNVSISDRASELKLLYPLNMKNPVPIIQRDWFNGGMGGGTYSTELYSLDSYAHAHKICDYGYTSADAGFEGMAYHYFNNAGVYIYEYQKDDMGDVTKDERRFYVQDDRVSYDFNRDYGDFGGEPQGKSQSLKIGQYVNPICRLKMRLGPDISSRQIMLLKPGTLFKVVQVWERETIGGLSANWVKVEPVNDDKSVEGNVIKNWLPAEETAAWVFGAYLE